MKGGFGTARRRLRPRGGRVRIGRRLVEPPDSIREPEIRRRAKLLSTLLVIPLLLGIVVLILSSFEIGVLSPHAQGVVVRITLLVVALVPIAYVLSRTRHFAAAAWVTLGVVLACTFLSALIMPSAPILLAFPILGAVVSSLFLSARATVAVLGGTVAAVLVLPAAIPELAYSNAVVAAFFIAAVGALVLIAASIHERDVERIEMASHELARSEERFRAVVEAADEAIITGDETGRIVAWNPAAQAIFGHRDVDALGSNVAGLMPARYRRAVERGLAALWRPDGERSASTFDAVALRANGTEFAVECSLVEWAIGEDRRFTAFVRDVSDRRAAARALRETSARLASSVAALEERNRALTTLSEMGEFFQACQSRDEAFAVVSRFAPRLFPGQAGGVWMLSRPARRAEAIAHWGEATESDAVFDVDACWALRRGRPHSVDPSSPAATSCRHVPEAGWRGSLCVPLAAHGDVLGLLHVRSGGGLASPTGEALRRLAMTAAEHIALAISNVRLRESLHHQSIRDPLSGVFNRRFMEETLAREMARSDRTGRPFGLILLDIDHFKRFNDTFGHDAGDLVIREIGLHLQQHFRGEDVACRYGGEEFALIVPGARFAALIGRAEEMRRAIRRLRLSHRDRPLGRVTISVGVALYPDHGRSATDLLRAADQATYQAKRGGRDRVATARRAASRRPPRGPAGPATLLRDDGRFQPGRS